MSKPERRLPVGSLILVTGANGYIGSHIVNILLQEGYNVRGTVRDKKPWLDALFEDKYGAGKFQSVVIPDLSVQEDLQAVLDGVSGVIHSVRVYLLVVKLTVEKAEGYEILVQGTNATLCLTAPLGLRSDSGTGPRKGHQRHNCAYPRHTESRRSSVLCQELRLDVFFKLRSSTCA